MKEIKITKDGDKICILYGDNIQEGVCGFGDFVEEAWDNFCTDFALNFQSLDQWADPKEIIELYDFLSWQFDQDFDNRFNDWSATNRKYKQLTDKYKIEL